MYKQTSVALEEKMDSRENPVEIERRSQHKSIKELEKEVDSKKSEICKLWRVKEKEKNSWRKKSLEDEVGWCYEHKDFCDVDSACPTWDPIPANSLEGKLPLAISKVIDHLSRFTRFFRQQMSSFYPFEGRGGGGFAQIRHCCLLFYRFSFMRASLPQCFLKVPPSGPSTGDTTKSSSKCWRGTASKPPGSFKGWRLFIKIWRRSPRAACGPSHRTALFLTRNQSLGTFVT